MQLISLWIHPILLLLFPCVVLSVTSLILGDARGLAMRWRGRYLLAGLLPGLLFLALFVSLGVHMYDALGGWPDHIGNGGFPQALALHAEATFVFFWWIFLATVFLVPLAELILLLARVGNRVLFTLGVHGLFFWLCVVLIFCAPDGFQYWWWD